MGRDAEITAEQVYAAADELRRNGVRPTVRAVRRLLGNVGSMGTINALMQKWYDQDGEAGKAGPRLLPAKVQRAVFDFLDEEVTRVHVDLAEELREARRDALALSDNNVQLAEQIEVLRSEAAGHAKDKAVLEGRISQLLDDLRGAQEAVATMRRHVEAERIALAVARQRLDKFAQMEDDLKRLRTDLEAQRGARVEAEQKAAVLRAQKDDLAERLAEMKTILRNGPTGASGLAVIEDRSP